MTSRSLEEELVDLAAHLDVPAAPTMAAAISTRIRSGEMFPPLGRKHLPRRVRWVVAGVAVAITGLVASPAVGDWFGIRGVEVVEQPATTAPPAGAALDLGRPSTLAEATTVLGTAPVLPAALGKPDAVWLDTRTRAPFVSFVYDGGPLVSEFDATMAEGPIVSKLTGGATKVEELQIDGRRAMWIEGVHQVVLRARDGDFVPERLRQSDSVLLVELGDLTVRIETTAGRDDAIRIARSIG